MPSILDCLWAALYLSLEAYYALFEDVSISKEENTFPFWLDLLVDLYQ
jgi:hypothetical protein